MKRIDGFGEVAQLLSMWWPDLKQEAYYDEELFMWALVYHALYYRTLPHKSLNTHEVNVEHLQAFFPEAVARYQTFIEGATELDMALAVMAGYEFDCSLSTAWAINDIFEIIEKKRSKQWTRRDIRVAAMTSAALMIYLRSIDVYNIDIHEVLRNIRAQVIETIREQDA